MGFFKDLFGGSSESAPPVVPVPTVEDDPYYDRNNDPAMGIFDGGTIAAMLKAGQNLAVGDTAENQWSGNDEIVEAIAQYWGAEVPNLAAIADEGVGPVNDWLKQHGVDLALQNQGPGLYMAAVQSATMFWSQAGRAAELDIPSMGERVPGFVLEGEQVEVFEDLDGHPFARIATKDGSHVYVCPLPEEYEPVGGIGLIDAARALVEMTQEAKQSRNYSGIHLPCVDYTGGCKLTALLGMNLGSLEIKEALTALSLKMNRFGAADKVASAAGGFESTPAPALVVDSAFFYFRTAPGSDLPLVTAVIPVSGFKDPGDDAIAA